MRRQQVSLKRNFWLGLATQLGLLALLVGSFVLGRFSVSKVVVPPAAPAAPEVVNSEGKVTTILLSDANATLIDQAMAAEQNLDFKTAAALLGKVKASGQHIRGLTFQLAQLAIFQGEPLKAMPLLNDALAEGDDLGEVYNLRATLSAGKAGLIRGPGMIDYETATKIDPFGARSFYYWGSALRRVGKDQAAIIHLQQAIDRLREPEEESLYRLTLRLAQIEAGQEKEFAAELADQLARPYPDMDWLITAAARRCTTAGSPPPPAISTGRRRVGTRRFSPRVCATIISSNFSTRRNSRGFIPRRRPTNRTRPRPRPRRTGRRLPLVPSYPRCRRPLPRAHR